MSLQKLKVAPLVASFVIVIIILASVLSVQSESDGENLDGCRGCVC